MLTADKIQAYADMGFPVEAFTKNRRRKAKAWQIKLAMSDINPADYANKPLLLIGAVLRRAKEFNDAESVEKFKNQAQVSVKLVKSQQECYRLKGWLIASAVVWYHTAFFGLVYFILR